MSQLQSVNDSFRQNGPVQIPIDQLRTSANNMSTIENALQGYCIKQKLKIEPVHVALF